MYDGAERLLKELVTFRQLDEVDTGHAVGLADAAEYFIRNVAGRDVMLAEMVDRWLNAEAYCEICGEPAEYDPDFILCEKHLKEAQNGS